jgi:hypothetical protein
MRSLSGNLHHEFVPVVYAVQITPPSTSSSVSNSVPSTAHFYRQVLASWASPQVSSDVPLQPVTVLFVAVPAPNLTTTYRRVVSVRHRRRRCCSYYLLLLLVVMMMMMMSDLLFLHVLSLIDVPVRWNDSM